MKITIGNLIDRLTICNIRIWMAEDIKRDLSTTDEQVARACRITNSSNKERNDLIEAIDKHFGIENNQGSNKMYGKE